MLEVQSSVAEVIAQAKKFEETAWFDPVMDHLIYLREDVAYRADRVDPALTLLWHPTKDKLVGLKLKGLQSIYDEMVKLMDKDGDHLIELTDVLRLIMVGLHYSDGLAEMEERRNEEWRKAYSQASRCARNFKLPSDLKKISLAS